MVMQRVRYTLRTIDRGAPRHQRRPCGRRLQPVRDVAETQRQRDGVVAPDGTLPSRNATDHVHALAQGVTGVKRVNVVALSVAGPRNASIADRRSQALRDPIALHASTPLTREPESGKDSLTHKSNFYRRHPRTIAALDPNFPTARQARRLELASSRELTVQIAASDGLLIVTGHGRGKTMDITPVDAHEYLSMSRP